MAQVNGSARKMFISSALQYCVFLIVYLLTRSYIISFVVWGLFLPTQCVFMSNAKDENVHVEHVFSLGRNWLTSLLISILCVLCYAFGFALLIFPAFIFFANYAFVFELANDGDTKLLDAFKKSKEISKGNRGKITEVALIFLFILILLVGFGILLTWTLSLFIIPLKPLFCYVGIVLGVSVYLIFVVPVEILTMSNLRRSIENSKSDIENDETQQNETEEAEVVMAHIVDDDSSSSASEKLDDRDDKDPTDLIF
jgi:membrane protein implicated in regulation of membrane protease activity